MPGINWDEQLLAPVMAAIGDAVTYRPANAPAFTIPDAIYDSQYTYVLHGGGANGEDVTTTSPMLGVRAAACPNPAQDDQVTIGTFNEVPVNLTFVVKDVRPDSHGHTILLLGQES